MVSTLPMNDPFDLLQDTFLYQVLHYREYQNKILHILTQIQDILTGVGFKIL